MTQVTKWRDLSVPWEDNPGVLKELGIELKESLIKTKPGDTMSISLFLGNEI